MAVVVQLKVLRKLINVIKVSSDPLEIEYLWRVMITKPLPFSKEKGAFETISPENGLILMHAEDDLSTLKTVEYADVEEKHFKGVSDFTVESLTLNVAYTARAALRQSFWRRIAFVHPL